MTIEQYACGELDAEQAEALLKHARECPSCSRYLEMLHKADRVLAGWADSMEPMMESGQLRTIECLRQMPTLHMKPIQSPGRWRWPKLAAAACVLIAAGFMAGQALRPSIDMDALARQWAASAQPRMEENITASVIETLRPEIVGEYAAMQDALSDQITLQLTAYAEQTVLRNDYQTYRLLSELIKAIQAAQVRNQQWALSTMQELDQQRLLDQQQVRSELATFAIYADGQLEQTQKKLQEIETRQ